MESERQVKRFGVLGCSSIVALVFVSAFALFYFSPYGRHIRYYGEAERIVDTLIIPFRNDLSEFRPDTDRLLNSPKYSDLKWRKMNVELEYGEVVRFHVNDMFDVGLMGDGTVNWHVH